MAAGYETQGLQDFLRHRQSERQNGNYLGDWKKDKKINVFLHTKQPPISLWRHGFPPNIVVLEDKATRESVKHVWGGRWNCIESEDVLKRQYKYADDGARKAPPVVCPICRLVYKVDRLVKAGRLSWTQTIFRFPADDPKETRIIHAGGLCGMYRDDLEDGQKAELKKAGISLSDAWQENGHAKGNYVFVVVVADHPEDGIQIAVETSSLGDRVRGVISDAMESAEREEMGDPFINPYCIQWEYRDEEKSWNNKYKARKIDKVKPTQPILDLIQSDKPDLSELRAAPNYKTLRALLERACLVKDVIPWDEVFAAREPPADVLSRHPDMQGMDPAPPLAAAPPNNSAAGEADEDVECDKDDGGCGGVMKASAPKCPHCGKVYDEEAAAAQPPPPPTPPARQLRKRTTKAKEAPPAQAHGGEQEGKEDSEDGIPF